jgi:hypothetical protein
LDGSPADANLARCVVGCCCAAVCDGCAAGTALPAPVPAPPVPPTAPPAPPAPPAGAEVWALTFVAAAKGALDDDVMVVRRSKEGAVGCDSSAGRSAGCPPLQYDAAAADAVGCEDDSSACPPFQ